MLARSEYSGSVLRSAGRNFPTTSYCTLNPIDEARSLRLMLSEAGAGPREAHRHCPHRQANAGRSLRRVIVSHPSASRLLSHRWRRRLLLDPRPVQLPEIAVIEKPAGHVRRDVACALLLKRVPKRELKTAIGASRRSLSPSIPSVIRLAHGRLEATSSVRCTASRVYG
jgi:hypothetical protein